MKFRENLEKLIKQYEEEAQKNLDLYIYFKDFVAYEKYMQRIEDIENLKSVI